MINIGIAGGPGSFNDSAVQHLIRDIGQSDVQIHYLDDTESVLRAIEFENIDLGQFALYNSYAGVYEECMEPMGRYRFRVHSAFPMQIVHCLMKHPSIEAIELTTIMSHREVLKQCRGTLANRFPHLKLIEGTGSLTDPGRIGVAIANGTIEATTAVVSNGLIAELFGLEILERDLQDKQDAVSTFLRVLPLNAEELPI